MPVSCNIEDRGKTIDLKKRYKIKESVDVYISELGEKHRSDDVKIQFYKINTREKVSIVAARSALSILPLVNGEKPLWEEIESSSLGIDQNEAFDFFSFLLSKGIIQEIDSSAHYLDSSEFDKYSRQVNFFDDFSSMISGAEAQKKLLDTKVIIFGAGTIGAGIAEQLCRAGVRQFTIVDPKEIKRENLERHTYAFLDDVGKSKTETLKDYLFSINDCCFIETYEERITPKTDLGRYISDRADMVINAADEPYIGHLTLKIGRFLWSKGIPLYVAGGFEAHYMSTGEFIIPHLTPCADCYSRTFTRALEDWQPVYASTQSLEDQEKTPRKEVKVGVSGLHSQSLFSISCATLEIVKYLVNVLPAGGTYLPESFQKRGEYLPNKGMMTQFKLQRQADCDVCKPK